MTYSPSSLRKIIKISLMQITASRHPLWSDDAEEILLMIAAHESGLGMHLRQIGNGPARGVFQIEPATMEDNYQNFIDCRPKLAEQIAAITGCAGPDVFQLQYNPIYGAIHARLKLYRSPGKLPDADCRLAMGEYCKLHYNSPGGSATAEKYVADYERLVGAA